MGRVIAILVAGVLVTGCAGPVIRQVTTLVGPDVDGAAAVLKASEDLLPANDPWLRCLTNLQVLNLHLVAGPGLQVQGGGLLTEAARLHVLDSLSQNLPPALKAACGEVVLQLLMRAGARMPGL